MLFERESARACARRSEAPGHTVPLTSEAAQEEPSQVLPGAPKTSASFAEEARVARH